MDDDILKLRTCPICKLAKLEREFKRDVYIDGEKKSVCMSCYAVIKNNPYSGYLYG